MSQCFTLSNIQFFNIRNLSIKLPLGDHFWSTIPNFDPVNYLTVSFNDDIENCRIQLQILLSQMPHLSSLSINESPFLALQLLTFERKHKSGYLLNLSVPNSYYDHDQCKTLISLPFLRQRKSLVMAVENRFCIIDHVQKMIRLQALNILCQDDQWKPEMNPNEDELLHWLREQLPPSCTIRRYSPYQMIGIWIS